MTRLGLVILLMLLSASAHAERFSIKCIWNPQFIITFDEESKRVVARAKDAMPHKGVIDSNTEDEIRFHILPEQPNGGGGVWNRKSGSFISLQSLNEPIDKRYEDHCFRTELQPVMEQYDNIWPW
jgi:hypothetical protein